MIWWHVKAEHTQCREGLLAEAFKRYELKTYVAQE